jgi:hypothetical protein
LFDYDSYITTPELLQVKSNFGLDLYTMLLDELKKLGPVRENKKTVSISLENRRHFASVMLRSRSLKLVFRANRRISSPRIHSTQHVAEKSFDHTILVESRTEIDTELLGWMAEAYQANG